MEWKDDSFAPTRPESPPKIGISIKVLEQTHEQFGKKDGPIISDLRTEAVADSGCQTCTAGPELLNKLKCSYAYLVKTKHKIVGITHAPLDILGTLFLRITYGGRSSNQMIYISKNCKGFYLSQTAMKDLGIVAENFPQSVSASMELQSDECHCPKRTPPPDRPKDIPFAPTQENIPKLKSWILDTFGSSAFNQCPHQELPMMTGEPVRLHLKEDAVPYAAHTPIPVPHHWKQKVKEDIDRDVRLKIIEKVPQGTTAEWCARMIVTSKKNGDPRRTVDLQKLNEATLREPHHTPSPFNVVSTVPTKTYRTVIDAWNGYHSLPLHEATKNSMTFITEWGRYRYCRAPMGYHVSGDAYTRRFDDITQGFPRSARIIDDTLLWDHSIAESFWHTIDYLILCAKNGIIFNKEKFQFCQTVVEFAGFELFEDGYRPLRKILSAIKDFPTPKSVTDVRSWFGLVNQLSYAFAQAPIMEPFRQLLSSKVFFWDETLDELFQASKDKIIKLVEDGVKTFETDRPTCLTTDWSKTGIGFDLTQRHCECPDPAKPDCGDDHWKLVFAGSRFTNDSESRYAPIEGEALAVVHGLQRCRMFVMGSPNLTVAVDHKPLIRILNDRELSSISNPRLLYFKEKTLMYRFKILHVPGKSKRMKVADTTSRNPVPAEETDEQSVACEAAALSFAHAQADGVTSIDWEIVQQQARHDHECIALAEAIANGFPSAKSDLPTVLHPYWNMREELYVIDGVPFKGHKMLVPKDLRRIVLEGLHAAHQGVSSMMANARERFFWPGLDAAVKLYRAQCRQCNEQAPTQHPESPIEPRTPEVPFEIVATDLCKLSGFSYLIYVDAYSGWVEVANLTSTNFRSIKKVFLMYFGMFGVPEEIAADGGPPFDSHDYKAFLKQWRIHQRLSSAYYAQSNGRAEAGVKTAKRILLGNVDPRTGKLDNENAVRALLAHRNTPCQLTGISPAMALFGRPIRDHLPASNMKLRDEWQEIAKKREEALAKRHLVKPPQETTKELPPLGVGDSVQIQNQNGNQPTKWNSTGFIAETLPNRQYRVVIDGSRHTTLRNRRFLKQIFPVCRQNVDYPSSLQPTKPVQTTTPSLQQPQDEQLPNPPQEPATPNAPAPPRPDVVPATQDTQPRRSARQRRAPRPLSPKLTGQSHD